MTDFNIDHNDKFLTYAATKEMYWVFIEPEDEEYAWAFLKSNGDLAKYNTLGRNTCWDHIPDKKEIIDFLSKVKTEFLFNYYVVQPKFINHELEIVIVAEGEKLINSNYKEL